MLVKLMSLLSLETILLTALNVDSTNTEFTLASGRSAVPKRRQILPDISKRLCVRCLRKPCGVDFSNMPYPNVICFCKPSCLNEAKCDTTGKCQCPPGFSGGDCGIPDSNVTCSSLSCQNGGSCLNYGTEGHHCSCPVPFSGRTCHMPHENSSHWCNGECGKRNRVCKPHLHDDQHISFECLEESEPCRIGPNCQNGYCEKNNPSDYICKDCWHGEFCDFYCWKNVLMDVEKCECPVPPKCYTGELCEDERKGKYKVFDILPVYNPVQSMHLSCYYRHQCDT